MTTARAKVRCRVCMEYRGRTNCAAAVGPTEQAAREGAQSTACGPIASGMEDRKSTRLNSSHSQISYAVFCLKKKKDPRDRRLAARHACRRTARHRSVVVRP